MTLFGWIILTILALTVLVLVISLTIIIKRASYLSKEKKELITFVIDMYIQYGEEIGITSEDKHEALIKKLNNIKEDLE